MEHTWIAAILGVVEGITEFLPVSSTGHLIVAGHLLGYTDEKAACFEIVIQSGAILAVVLLFRHRFRDLVPLPENRRAVDTGFTGWRGLSLLALTTLPAVVAGLLFHKTIKAHLFSPVTVAWALAVGGVLILVAERFKPTTSAGDLNDLRYGQAFAIGLFQCLALWPGMSRSASTIIGGLFTGLDRNGAAEYSFLAAVPVLVAATAYELYKEFHLLSSHDLIPFVTGFVVSFVFAAIAVKTFIKALQRWTLAPYAYYRIALAPLIYLVLCR
ncbi:MAG: undecaprenyl-diphosphate phosphatase [Thermodesulfobacteriota bacterium]